ncbi:MAG: RDD family protein, partial [Dietzia sp.]|nr:RDD family protein [Dietzia sp.]
MRDVAGSWLSGPTSGSGPEQKFKGENLGLPESGPGSMAPLGVRFGALVIDWFLAYGLVAAIVSVGGPGALGGDSLAAVSSWAVPLVWGVLGVVCVWLFAQTPGQAVLGIGTARVDAEERVGFVRSLVRVVFIFFLLPPLIQDED